MMTKRRVLKILATSLLSAFISGSALPGNALAAPEWTARIAASYSYDNNQVILGAATDATDGFENGYDSRAIVAGSLMTYFYHPEWAASTPDGAEYYWTDVRATDLPKEWTFYISSSYTNKTINLAWEVTGPDTLGLTFYDDTQGSSVDMKAQTAYSYTNTSSAARAFRVVASGSLPGSGGSGGGGDTGGGTGGDTGGGSTPPADTTAPETSITGITEGKLFTTSTVNAGFSGTDETSAASALQYSYKVDSGSWSSWSTNTATALSGIADGSHTLYAKAKDEAGNEDATPAQAGFKVDTTAPLLYILNYETTSTTKTTYTVKVNCSTSDGVSGIQSLSYSVTDEYNMVALSGSATPPSSGYTFDFSVSLDRRVKPRDRNGRVYTITVTATDKAGFTATKSTTYTVTGPPHRKPLY